MKTTTTKIQLFESITWEKRKMTYLEEHKAIKARVGSVFTRQGSLMGSTLFAHNPNFLLTEVEEIKNPQYELGALDSTMLFICKFIYTDRGDGIKSHNECITGLRNFERLYKKVV